MTFEQQIALRYFFCVRLFDNRAEKHVNEINNIVNFAALNTVKMRVEQDQRAGGTGSRFNKRSLEYQALVPFLNLTFWNSECKNKNKKSLLKRWVLV